ncbi:PucR family transcriptional regulator [Nocardioides caldifontis]|uniref:PucR family transcriptional regulator n=1 Tax=Nocardioides caldifontis TaxID=2588938 RepID=UPI0011DF5E87|nr:helix-turn-helix domain-containing protein [Nocardioides caldifontis]
MSSQERRALPGEVRRQADDVAALISDLVDRATRGTGVNTSEHVAMVHAAGVRAAEVGLSAGEAVELYLSVVLDARGDADAWSGEALLAALRDAIPVLVQAHQSAGQTMVRQQAVARVEFIDDLLRGDADIASLVQRAEPFGLDLSASHQVVLATPTAARLVEDRDQNSFNRTVLERYGDRGVLVTTKANHLVAVLPVRAGRDVDEPARELQENLRRTEPRRSWRFAVGRPYAGPYGVARSYQQAREAIVLAERLHPEDDMVPTRDLLIYRVLGRDRAALADLVETVLTPLTRARGGPEPLIDTLETYFATREVATETARRLHVSVRTVTYRLARITQLTEYDPSVPTQRLTLQAAIVGARLLPWPASEQK